MLALIRLNTIKAGFKKIILFSLERESFRPKKEKGKGKGKQVH